MFNKNLFAGKPRHDIEIILEITIHLHKRAIKLRYSCIPGWNIFSSLHVGQVMGKDISFILQWLRRAIECNSQRLATKSGKVHMPQLIPSR